MTKLTDEEKPEALRFRSLEVETPQAKRRRLQREAEQAEEEGE